MGKAPKTVKAPLDTHDYRIFLDHVHRFYFSLGTHCIVTSSAYPPVYGTCHNRHSTNSPNRLSSQKCFYNWMLKGKARLRTEILTPRMECGIEQKVISTFATDEVGKLKQMRGIWRRAHLGFALPPNVKQQAM